MAEELFQINLIKAIAELKKRFPKEPLNCLETGTLRNLAHKHNSTLHISNALSATDTFTSVDIDPKYIKISKEACNNNPNTKWVISDSIAYLKTILGKFHFVFLDTANCKDFIFDEFKLVAPHMHTNGIIIIDDAGVLKDGSIDTTTTRVKGHKVSQFLFSLGLTDVVRNSPIGTQLWIDMSVSTTEKILNGLSCV